jgi:hypothetical protein
MSRMVHQLMGFSNIEGIPVSHAIPQMAQQLKFWSAIEVFMFCKGVPDCKKCSYHPDTFQFVAQFRIVARLGEIMPKVKVILGPVLTRDRHRCNNISDASSRLTLQWNDSFNVPSPGVGEDEFPPNLI